MSYPSYKIIPVTEGQRRELRKRGYSDERIDKMSKGQATGILSQVPNPPSNEQYRDFLKNRKAAEYKEKLFERAGENSEIFGNCVVTLADITDLFEEVFGNDEE